MEMSSEHDTIELTEMWPVLSNVTVLLPEEALVYENHCKQARRQFLQKYCRRKKYSEVNTLNNRTSIESND